MNPLLSFYPGGVKDTKSQESISLQSLHEGEVSGKWKAKVEEYHREIRRVGKDAAKRVKWCLPTVTLAGKFSPSRKDEHMVSYSGLVFLDIDNIGKERATEIRNAVAETKDPFVVRASLSASHDGVRLLVRVTTGPENHAAAWEAAANYFRKRYGVFLTREQLADGKTIDAAVKDLSRPCFVSYDPEAYINPDAWPLEVPNIVPAPNGASVVGSGENIDGSALDHLPASDITLADVAEMLEKLDASKGRGYWLEVAAALRHQFPTEPDASVAYGLFDQWSATGNNYVDSDDTRKLWDSLKPVPKDKRPATIRTVIKMAQDAGWSQARSGVEKARAWFTAEARTVEELLRDGPAQIAEAKPTGAQLSELVDLMRGRLKEHKHTGTRASTIRDQVRELRNAACSKQPIPLPQWARDFVYVAGENKFYNTRTGQGFVPDSVDHMFKKFMPDADIPPHEFLLMRCDLQQADTKAYDPGEAAIFTDEKGRTCMNTYRRTYAEADHLNAERAGELLLRHVALLIAEPEHQQTVIDIMAYVVQQPGKKMLWALVIQGVQGCGKSTLGVIMADVLGRSNVRTLEAGGTLKSAFNGYVTTQLIVYVETRIVGDNPRALLEKLKPLISDPWAQVERKYVDADNEKNVGNYMFFTNHHDALPIDENERRFFVLRSPLQTRADLIASGMEAHFKELYAFLEAHPGAFRSFLETWTISPEFNPHGHAPETQYKRDMVLASESWLRSALRTSFEESDTPSFTSELFSFSELKSRVVAATGHQRFTDQALTGVLNELGFRRVGRFNIRGAKLNLWTSCKWTNAAPEEVRAAYEGLLIADELLTPAASMFG